MLFLPFLPAHAQASTVGKSSTSAQSVKPSRPSHPSSTPIQTQAAFARDVLPVVQRYCTNCHSGTSAQAGINLALYKDTASVLKAGDLWDRVASNVSSGHMPPAGMPAPAKAQRDTFADWIQTTASAAACSLHDPGHVTLRRLNRVEYNNTMRDLCGVDIHPADTFPNDDTGYGFDNIGDVLSISPLLMEKYLSAAEKVAHATFENPDDFLPPASFGATALMYLHQADRQNGTDGDHASLPATGSEAGIDYSFPRDSEYLLRAIAWQDRAGAEAAQMQFLLDGKPLQSVAVANEGRDHRPYTIRVQVPAGKHRFSVAFLNDFYDGSAVRYDKSHYDRNLNVQALEIVGPLHSRDWQSPLARRLQTLHPEETQRENVARAFLSDFARRAYRRPVTQEEVSRLMRYVQRAHSTGDTFQQGIEAAMTACLCSPYFLFHTEAYAPTLPSARISTALVSSRPATSLRRRPRPNAKTPLGVQTHPPAL